MRGGQTVGMGAKSAARRHVEYRRCAKLDSVGEEQCAYLNQGRNNLKEASNERNRAQEC